MAPRALSSATIAFGLVSIPVKLFTAYESGSSIRFNQIHAKDGSRVKQQLISSNTGEPVPKDEIVKGYEFAKGQYVLFSDEELKALEAETTHAIDIQEFIPAELVPRIYLERVYYLGPDKGGARAYHLLSQALADSGRAALGRYAARGKQYLVLIRPQDNGLCMEQLRYTDELRNIDQIPIEEAEVKPEELVLAQQIIDQAASDEFAPENYKDEVRERTLELIERKVAGEDISVAPVEAAQNKVIDLMAALKASIEGKAASPTAKPATKRKAKAKATAKSADKAAEKAQTKAVPKAAGRKATKTPARKKKSS